MPFIDIICDEYLRFLACTSRDRVLNMLLFFPITTNPSYSSDFSVPEE